MIVMLVKFVIVLKINVKNFISGLNLEINLNN